jgi:3-oxocholest-4-en-26-oyl-CoA dehydrogenase beta subunit
VLARVPLLETCAVAMSLQRDGDPGPAAELLPRVDLGEPILTVGANGRTGHDPAELAVTAIRDSNGKNDRSSTGDSGDSSVWVLDGAQSGVPWARSADRIAAPAHTADGRAVLALTHRTAEGITPA